MTSKTMAMTTINIKGLPYVPETYHGDHQKSKWWSLKKHLSQDKFFPGDWKQQEIKLHVSSNSATLSLPFVPTNFFDHVHVWHTQIENNKAFFQWKSEFKLKENYPSLPQPGVLPQVWPLPVIKEEKVAKENKDVKEEKDIEFEFTPNKHVEKCDIDEELRLNAGLFVEEMDRIDQFSKFELDQDLIEYIDTKLYDLNENFFQLKSAFELKQRMQQGFSPAIQQIVQNVQGQHYNNLVTQMNF